MESGQDVVALLQRWEGAGGVWRVIGQQDGAVTVGLYRCDGGEEADRFTSSDPGLEELLAGRTSSHEPDLRSPGPTVGGRPEQRDRDRDAEGRARQARPRDRLGRPLPYGGAGVEPVSEQPLPPAVTISSARDLLADGRPFSAHEVFEARWKAGPHAERDLWQGLAQVCVGITHAERGNLTGALRLIERARARLAAYSATGGPTYELEIDRILGWIRERERDPGGGSWLLGHPL